jgi:hypothetical protein
LRVKRFNEELLIPVFRACKFDLVLNTNNLSWDKVSMANNDFIAWSPDGFSAPIGLLAVLVPTGEVTEQLWIDALSDRVLVMAERESNPQEAAEWACNALGCPVCESPRQFGTTLVRDNPKLLSAIRRSVIDEFPFPNYGTKESLEARGAIQNTNLETWVGHAEFLMNGIRLATYIRSEQSATPELDGSSVVLANTENAEIKPYSDFINQYELAICEPQFGNPGVCTVSTPRYDFSYSLAHQYQWVVLHASFLPNESIDYGLLSDFDEPIKIFNEKHATKITCLYDERKPFFFKPIYKPSIYTLKIEAPLSSDAIDINKIHARFYGDVLDFFNCGSFDVLVSEAKSKRGSTVSFPVFLEKLIEYLDFLRENPDHKNGFDIDSGSILGQ